MVKKEKATSHSWTWIKAVAAFLAGLVVGELKIGRRRNRDGCTTIGWCILLLTDNCATLLFS